MRVLIDGGVLNVESSFNFQGSEIRSLFAIELVERLLTGGLVGMTGRGGGCVRITIFGGGEYLTFGIVVKWKGRGGKVIF